jgi:hypothetical protein
MLTIATVPLLMMVLAVNADEAEVISAKLCASEDYDAAARNCASGKALEGADISVKENSALTLLSSIKSDSSKDISHVWIADDKTEVKKGGKVTVYESGTKTMRDANQAELDWLKERKIEGAQVIVKLPVAAAAAYRTRSVKTFGPKSAGQWRVQIYDSGLTPLKEITFTVSK